MLRSFLLLIVLLSASAMTRAEVQTPIGEDSFDSPFPSPSWLTPVIVGSTGALTQTGGHLEYTTGASPDPNGEFVYQEWADYGAVAPAPWTFQIDVHLPTFLTTNDAGYAQLGLMLFSQTDSFYVYVFENASGGSVTREFIVQDGSSFYRAPITVNDDTAIRLRYSDTGGGNFALFGEYDGDGAANGYSWTTLVSTGALNGPALGTLALFGNSMGLVVPAGTVYADNASAVPEPSTYAMLAIGMFGVAFFARRRSA